MKKTIIILAAALTGASLFSCGAVDSSKSEKAASVTESSTVLDLPVIDRAEIVAESTDEGDGYMFRLDVEGNIKYWTADVTTMDCGEQNKLSVSTRDYDRNSRYLTGGSTITEISAVVTPYDKDNNAGKPVSVKWDPERIEKTTSKFKIDTTESTAGTETNTEDGESRLVLNDTTPECTGCGDAFVGVWGSGRATLVVKKIANNTFTAEIKWGSSASESTYWTYDYCNYSPFTDTLVCEGGGTCTELKYSEDGKEISNTVFEGSNAEFTLNAKDKIITWSDDKETADEGLEFVLCQ